MPEKAPHLDNSGRCRLGLFASAKGMKIDIEFLANTQFRRSNRYSKTVCRTRHAVRVRQIHALDVTHLRYQLGLSANIVGNYEPNSVLALQ